MVSARRSVSESQRETAKHFPLPQSVPHTKLVSRWGGQDGERTKSVHLRRHGVDIGQVAAPYTIMEYVCMSNLYVDIYVRIICMLYV